MNGCKQLNWKAIIFPSIRAEGKIYPSTRFRYLRLIWPIEFDTVTVRWACDRLWFRSISIGLVTDKLDQLRRFVNQSNIVAVDQCFSHVVSCSTYVTITAVVLSYLAFVLFYSIQFEKSLFVVHILSQQNCSHFSFVHWLDPCDLAIRKNQMPTFRAIFGVDGDLFALANWKSK